MQTQKVEVKRGDFVIVRTGQMGQRLRAGEWGGYAGGDAPARADKFAARFDKAVANAKREAMRKMFTPLQWGFGGNGWTWES